MHFRIIKLTNHDNPKEFTLEITRMRDIRQRIGILITGYNNHLNLDRPPKPSFNMLSKLNYSYYAVYRGDFDTFEDVKQKRDELYDIYNMKVKNYEKKEVSNINIVSFK